MKLQIIRNAHLEGWRTCANCKSEMTVEESDWEYGLLGDHADYAEYYYYIECPNCDATILKDDTNV